MMMMMMMMNVINRREVENQKLFGVHLSGSVTLCRYFTPWHVVTTFLSPNKFVHMPGTLFWLEEINKHGLWVSTVTVTCLVVL
jgi:hypothetical protein